MDYQKHAESLGNTSSCFTSTHGQVLLRHTERKKTPLITAIESGRFNTTPPQMRLYQLPWCLLGKSTKLGFPQKQRANKVLKSIKIPKREKKTLDKKKKQQYLALNKYIRKYHRCYNKKSGSWSVYPCKEMKTYPHIRELIQKALTCRLENTQGMRKKLKEDGPRRISRNLAPQEPPSSQDLVKEKISRF